MNNIKIGFIGAGNMASAIIKGMLKSKNYKPENILIFDVNQSKYNDFQTINLTCFDNVYSLVEMSDIIILAVKPQQFENLLKDIKSRVNINQTIVSIAPGISTNYIKKMLDKNCPVIRVMPNTPLLVGKGASALSKSQEVNDAQLKIVKDIFASSGEVHELDESQMDSIVAVNGSSPAYVYLFAKAMCDYATSENIDQKTAMDLICKTLEGSAEMLRSAGHTPDELIKMVCSPNGTTERAIKSLEAGHFYETIQQAMRECTRRARELSL